ncbi:MAG TPA: sugar MFS transporter [Pseudacidobacterium sp.]|jgi:FHS family L-fucose permease-like MFS transporter|nr:sugar MFS transporter [Pseudacidobacterium sp.]
MAITNVSSSSTSTINAPGNTNRGAMAMVTTLFFMWGFLTSLNDILIPHLKSIFSLNYAEAMLVQFAFFSSYAVFALPAGKIIEWVGYQRTMVVGLFTMGLGAILFVPAASAPSFPLFLSALIVLAAGITVLQVAANPYVSILGPPETAASRLNLTQAFNSLGTTIAPWFGGWLILKEATTVLDIKTLTNGQLQAYKIQQASTVKVPYIAIALALAVLALIIAFYHFPRIDTTREFRRPKPGEHEHHVWNYPHVILGAIAIFVYVGAEVSIGSFLVNYFNQPNIGNLTVQAAANYVPFYWGGAMIGRFIGSAVLQKVRPGYLLGLCAIIALLLVIISMATIGHFAMWSILLVGLFNSIMFPTIFTLGIAELGPLTGKASGLLIFSIVGGAIIPLAQGAIADRVGIHHAFVLPVLCYLFIAYYGFKGSRVVVPA